MVICVKNLILNINLDDTMCVYEKKEIVTVLSSVISSLLSVYLVAVVEVVVEPVGEVVVVGEECVVVSVGS